MGNGQNFVLGLDLDGVVADFYSYMRTIVAEWRGVPENHLTPNVTYGLPEWGLKSGEYERIHRFAVTQRSLFSEVSVIPKAAQSIRRLGTEGVRIRIITHRLFIRHFHKTAVQQTVEWLDSHAIPYWDLCFMRDKALVDADIYVEDSPSNIEDLLACKKEVITFTNSTNIGLDVNRRAADWDSTENMIRESYYSWLDRHSLERPPDIGVSPAWLKT